MKELSKKEKLNLEKKKEKNKKKLILLSILFIFIIGIVVVINFNNNKSQKEEIYGDDVIEMQYFYLTTCPHCIEQKKFHKYLLEKYLNLRINQYEITESLNRAKYLEFAKAQNFKDPENIATPTTFIGNRSNIGFGTPETTGKILISMIEDENARILKSWDNKTMKTTLELRNNAVKIN